MELTNDIRVCPGGVFALHVGPLQASTEKRVHPSADQRREERGELICLALSLLLFPQVGITTPHFQAALFGSFIRHLACYINVQVLI